MARSSRRSPTPRLVAGWGQQLLEKAALAIPVALITEIAAWVQGRFFAQPWQILWIAIPLSALALFAWKLASGPAARRFDLRFAVFLCAFASVFSVLASTDLLVWKRVPVAEFRGDSARNWLLPVGWGDWRYWLVHDSSEKVPLVVLLKDHQQQQSRPRKRQFDAQIISTALDGQAKGVFFDVAYSNGTPEDARADPVLCGVVEAASATIPIVTSYGLQPVKDTGLYSQVPEPSQAPACLVERPEQQVYRAHAMVFADVDSTVRSIPVSWIHAADRSALSVKIAQCMKSGCAASDLKLPAGTLLRFVRNAARFQIVEGDARIRELFGSPTAFAGKFLLVGERSPYDLFRTPGDKAAPGDDSRNSVDATPGVLIHAYAVASLLSGRYFERPPAWLSAFIVIACCGVLSIFALKGASVGRLAMVAAVESAAIVALAAFGAAVFLVWLDVIYAVVPLWLLLPLLLAYRRIVRQ